MKEVTDQSHTEFDYACGPRLDLPGFGGHMVKSNTLQWVIRCPHCGRPAEIVQRASLAQVRKDAGLDE